MSTRQTFLRAFTGRYLIALLVAAAVMIGSVITANVVIDRKIASVKRVSVKTAPPPPQGANYLLLGSGQPGVRAERDAAEGVRKRRGRGRSALRHDDVIHIEPELPEDPDRVVSPVTCG